MKRAGELLARGNKAPAVDDAQKVIDYVQRRIGQLQVEHDFLAGQPATSRLLRRRAMIAPEAGLSVSRQCARRLGLRTAAFINGRGRSMRRNSSF